MVMVDNHDADRDFISMSRAPAFIASPAGAYTRPLLGST
jgi:hypothetical protein